MYELQVEGARLFVRKEKHCCSREARLNLSGAVEELESARSEPLEPADRRPANGNER